MHDDGQETSGAAAGRAQPQVSVVVPAHAVATTIGATLDALAPQVRELGAELVVVDDASTDGTSEVVTAWAQRHPEVACTLVRTAERRGINGSRNAGVAFARGAWVAFTDGDDVVEPGWLVALVGASGVGRVVSGWARDGSTGWAYPPIGFFGVGRPTVFGSSFMAERTMLEAVGGFDEQVRRGGTETEFALTAQLDLGATVVHAPDAVVWYRQPDGARRALGRTFAQQRGHALIARRIAARRDGTTTSFTVRRRLRAVATALASCVSGRSGPRREQLPRVLTELVAIAWLVRFTVALPPPRRWRPSDLDRYVAVVRPAG